MPLSPSKAPRLPILLTVGMALCATALVVVVFTSRSRQQRLQEQAAALQAKLESATAQSASLAAVKEGEPSPPARTPAKPTAPPSADPAAAPADDTTTGDTTPDALPRKANEMAAWLKNPMMQKIMASQTETMMQATYGQLMNRLDLTPEERAHLLGLLVEKQTNVQNLGMQLMNPDLPAEGRAEIMEQLKGAWMAGEAKIQEFINDEADFAYYQSYNQQEPERKEVGMFEASLPKDDPLDAATADALASLQNERRKAFPFTVDFYDQQNFGNPAVLNPAAVNTFLEEQTRFQAQVADEAARLLSPARLELYKKNQAAVHQMSAMQLNTIVQMAGGSR